MAELKFIAAPEKVSAHIKTMDKQLAAVIQRIREVILEAHPMVAEHIKWNSPAFFYSGPMKPFNPKEYKRDILVINTHRGKILLVLPTGNVIPDDSGFLEGTYTDGRRIITIKDLNDINAKKSQLQLAINKWIELIE